MYETKIYSEGHIICATHIRADCKFMNNKASSFRTATCLLSRIQLLYAFHIIDKIIHNSLFTEFIYVPIFASYFNPSSASQNVFNFCKSLLLFSIYCIAVSRKTLQNNFFFRQNTETHITIASNDRILR